MNDTEYLKASNGSGEPPRASVTITRTSGATTLTVDAVTNWPPFFVATSGVLNTETGVLNPATVKVFKGHIASGKIEIDVFAPGYTDAGNAVGDIVVLKPNTLWADIIADSLATIGTSIDIDGSLTAAAITETNTAAKTALQADTNFRTKPRASIGTTAATLTPDINTYNIYELSAQASALAIANPTGTPNAKDVIMIYVKDNGTARAITFPGGAYTNISGLDLPTTTVANKWTVFGIVYNTSQPAWQIVSISTEA